MVTLKELINSFETFADNHTQINDFYFGSYDTSNHNFPILCVELLPSSSNNITEYKFNIKVYDLLEQDFSNKLDSINNSNIIINDFKEYFYDNIMNDSTLDIELGVTDDFLSLVSSEIVFEVISNFCGNSPGLTPSEPIPTAPNDYYTKTECDNNFLSGDTSYYTQLEVNNNFLSASTFIPSDFYSKVESDANYLSATTSFYTQSEATNNFLSASTYIPDSYTKAELNIIELVDSTKINYDSYIELTEDLSGNTTQVDYWSNSGKTLKLFSKVITYVDGSPTTIVNTDEISSKVLTTNIEYSGSTILNITKTYN